MTTFKVRVKKYDLTLLVVLMLLILAGLVILYSTSVYNGEVKFHDAMYYLKKQLFATALGLAVMYLVAGIDYHIWKYADVYKRQRYGRAGILLSRRCTSRYADGQTSEDDSERHRQ